MYKTTLIFFIFMVAKWYLLAVKADEDAEIAVATLSKKSTNKWNDRLLRSENYLFKKCRRLILASRGTELPIGAFQRYYLNVTFQYIKHARKKILVLECKTADDVINMFTGGKNRVFVSVESKYDTDDDPEFVLAMVLPKGYRKWKYIYKMSHSDDLMKNVCQKIFDAHTPSYRYEATKAFRALRHGTDPINGSPIRFITLLCYYESDHYLEYCEGDNNYQVFQVTCLGDECMPMRTVPIEVDYQI